MSPGSGRGWRAWSVTTLGVPDGHWSVVAPAGAFALEGRAPSRAGERIRVRELRGSKIARAVAGRWPSPVVGVREAGARSVAWRPAAWRGDGA